MGTIGCEGTGGVGGGVAVGYVKKAPYAVEGGEIHFSEVMGSSGDRDRDEVRFDRRSTPRLKYNR